MWRTFALVAAVAFLLVSVAGNVVLFARATGNARDAQAARDHAATIDADRGSLEARVNQLNAENQRLRAAASPGTTTLSAPGEAAASVDPTILTSIEDQVSALRGLPRTRDVPLRFMTRDALRAYLVQSFDRDYLPRERESDQKLYVTLGLIRPDEDLVQLTLDLLQEQVLGFYDEDEKAMYVVADGGAFTAAEKATFAHEFTHALQDQAFDFQSLRPPHNHDNDRYAAATAIAEGDAMLTERLWTQAHLTADEIAQLSASGGDSTRLNQAPLAVRTEMLFPYISGFDFVRRAYQGSSTFSSVDALFRSPPESTSQILHPERYASHTRPVDVALPDLAAAMGQGWRQIDSNVLGELDLRIVMEQFGTRSTAARAAAGWSGDRWALLEKDGRQALVLRTTWSSETAARDFFDTFGLALKSRFPGAPFDANDSTRQALTATTYATDLRRGGQDVLAVISFDRPTADALTKAVGGF